MKTLVGILCCLALLAMLVYPVVAANVRQSVGSVVDTTEIDTLSFNKYVGDHSGSGAGTGDIEGVTAGAGLTGGGTSGEVSLAVGAGTGITVNADDIAVKWDWLWTFIDTTTAEKGKDSSYSNILAYGSLHIGSADSSGRVIVKWNGGDDSLWIDSTGVHCTDTLSVADLDTARFDAGGSLIMNGDQIKDFVGLGMALVTNAVGIDWTWLWDFIDSTTAKIPTAEVADSAVAVPDSIACLDIKCDTRGIFESVDAETTIVDYPYVGVATGDSATPTIETIEDSLALAGRHAGQTWTGVHDFGGATSLEIPNGANPTTDAEGEIAWDSDDDAIEVYSGDEAESGLIPFYQKIDAMIFKPDQVNDQVAIFHVDALLYPFGIEIDQVSITLPADAAYSMVFEEWAGDPPAAQADIETVTTGAGDSYMEDGTITNDQVDADDYIFLDIPATDVDWIHVQVIYHVIQGD